MINHISESDPNSEVKATPEIESQGERIEDILARAQSSRDLFNDLYRRRDGDRKSFKEVIAEVNQLAPEAAKSPIVFEHGTLAGTHAPVECEECGQVYQRYEMVSIRPNVEYWRDFSKQPFGDYELTDLDKDQAGQIDGDILRGVRTEIRLPETLHGSDTETENWNIDSGDWHALNTGGHQRTTAIEHKIIQASDTARRMLDNMSVTPEDYDRIFRESRSKVLSAPWRQMFFAEEV